MKKLLLITLFFAGLFTMLHAASSEEMPSLLWLPLNENAGFLTSDRSPNHFDAELNNVQWARGTFGNAVHFSGSNSFIKIPPIPALNGATQFTLSVWVTWEGTGRYPNLLSTDNWSPGGMLLFVSDDECAFRMGRPGQRAGVPGDAWTETSVPILNALPRNRWVHLCVVFSMPRITTYVNGKAVAHGNWNYPVEANGMRLGNWSGAASHQGLMSDLRLYGRALTDAEVGALAQDSTRTDAACTLIDELKIVRPLAASYENRRARLDIDIFGRLHSLRDKSSQRELLARTQPFVRVRLKNGQEITARKVSRKGGTLEFVFPRGLGTAAIKVETHDDFFLFTVQSLTVSNAAELAFASIPAVHAKYAGPIINMLSDDEEAVCLRGCDLAVETWLEGDELRVWTTAEHGLTGWRAGLAAGPKPAMTAMLRAMAQEAHVPVSHVGGPWALGAEANRGSYLFADLVHASTDDWIELARRGGFSYIHINEWAHTLGHYDLNTNRFPHGLADLQDSVSRIHAAGLKAGIHTLTGCIQPEDAFVTPEASPYLIAAASYTLARPMSPTDTVLYINEKPSAHHDVVFTYTGNGNAIRIGTEIIQYEEVLSNPPYGFARCVRGAFKTRPAAHPAGDHADYLQQLYIAFYPQPGSPLANDVADHIARVFNAGKLDQIYFDGAEGMKSRYGVDFMRDAIFKRLQGEVLVESSSYNQYSWWFQSRLGTWDHPVWAAKRFVDHHIAMDSVYRSSELLEPQMGWWAPRAASSVARGHFLDEMEYFAGKNLGLDSAMAVQGVDVSRGPLPQYIENQITLLGWYEHLRLARYFDTQTVARVAVPGLEFRLRQNQAGTWQFTPVTMQAHRISAIGNGSEHWISDNPYAAQPFGARVEALYSAAPYNASNRVCVMDYASLAVFKTATASSDIALQLSAETADVKEAGRGLRLHATNKGPERRGAWARASLNYGSPYRSLSGAGAMGVWIKGDGKGALLNIQFENPREYMHSISEHYVTLDFKGWRYVELLLRERDAEQMANHVWPYQDMYGVYRNPLDMAHISDINIYLNNLPSGDGTDVVLGPVMALPVQPNELKNPVIVLNGQTMVLPVAMKSGEFLELEPSGLCFHYDENGNLLGRVSPATAAWPTLVPGTNNIAFNCQRSPALSARAEVTLNVLGTPFGTMNARANIDWKHLVREYEMTRVITVRTNVDETWNITVRPGEKAALEFELCGAMESPVLTVGNSTLHFPVTLKSTQRLVCRDQRHWVVTDAAHSKVAEGQLDRDLPVLEGSLNRIGFNCARTEGALIKLVKVYR